MKIFSFFHKNQGQSPNLTKIKTQKKGKLPKDNFPQWYSQNKRSQINSQTARNPRTTFFNTIESDSRPVPDESLQDQISDTSYQDELETSPVEST